MLRHGSNKQQVATVKLTSQIKVVNNNNCNFDIIDRPYCNLFGTEHLIILSTLTSRGQIAQNV